MCCMQLTFDLVLFKSGLLPFLFEDMLANLCFHELGFLSLPFSFVLLNNVMLKLNSITHSLQVYENYVFTVKDIISRVELQ